MGYLIKIDRIAAWILFVGLLLYFVSGYGMTKGIIDPSLAAKIHTQYLTYIILAAFVTHTGFAIHMAFKRWQVWNAGTKTILILFYLVFSAFFIVVDRYYTPAYNAVAPAQAVQDSITPVSSSTTATNSPAPQVKTFSAAELAQYNGQNGQPSYVAVDGAVYDLTRVFRGGWHATHFAGKDLTGEFYSQHAKNILSRYPVVGKLVN